MIDREYIRDISERALCDVEDGNYDSAITKSRTLLEEVFCYVIEKKKEVPSTSGKIDVLYKPISTISIKIIAKIAIINTSSNIIMYSISLIIIIIRLDTNIKATISSKVKPNTW